MSPERYVSARTLAELLEIPVGTVRQRAHDGTLREEVRHGSLRCWRE